MASKSFSKFFVRLSKERKKEIEKEGDKTIIEISFKFAFCDEIYFLALVQ